MVEIVTSLPEKKATMTPVPNGKPRIIGEPGKETIQYYGLTVPKGLNKEFLKKCNIEIKYAKSGLTKKEVAEEISKTTKRKDLFLRLAGEKPLSVVTDKFQEIMPSELLEETVRVLGTNPTVRYFRNDETLQFNFPLETRFKGLYLMLDTGSYGTYGGSGDESVKFGISWYNKTCANWTVFLSKYLGGDMKRIVHMDGKSLDAKLDELVAMSEGVGRRITESKGKKFSYEELDRYLAMYESKGLVKGITNSIRSENPKGMSAYDLSYRLTELCQGSELSDTTRAKIEYIAGESVLCHDDISGKVQASLEGGELVKNTRPRVDEEKMRRLGLVKCYVRIKEHSEE